MAWQRKDESIIDFWRKNKYARCVG